MDDANGYAFPIGTTNVVYKVTDAAENAVTCAFSVVVKGIEVSGTIKYNNIANTPMTNTTITLQQGANVYTQFSTDGSYSFANVCSGIYQVTLSTGKPVGGINSTDAAQVSAWSLNPLETDLVRFLAGDVVGSTAPGSWMEIRSNDASRILDYFVLGQTLTPAWEFWEAGIKVSEIELQSTALEINIPAPTASINSVTHNFLGLVTGDFNRNFVPDVSKSASGSESITLFQGESVSVQPFTKSTYR